MTDPYDMLTPEQRARVFIEERLREAGWVTQGRADLNLHAGRGVAVREIPTAAGPADYGLFINGLLCGILEAKKQGTRLSQVEAQTQAYAQGVGPPYQVPVQPLPFLYESTGTSTYFANGLDPIARSRRVFSFHRPETLEAWLEAEVARTSCRPGAPSAATLQGRMRAAPPLNSMGMWPAQIRAVENLEAAIRDGKSRMLIQMATGSGKTYTAIAAVNRLVAEGGARRVLFLVDRGNLGRQALSEFTAYTVPGDGRKFSEIYPVVNLQHNNVGHGNKVVISTIQRLYSILTGEPDLPEDFEEHSAFLGQGAALVKEPKVVRYSEALPPDFFDIIVIDECHRSIYNEWRQVLEYYDASLIGLTATPASHTYAFFHGNVVSEYRHEHAVRDRVNVPFVVYEIRTQITEKGAKIEAGHGKTVAHRNRLTRELRWKQLDQDVEYTGSQLDRSVVAQDQIRTVLREVKDRLFTDIFPGRTTIPKTLVFAKSDDHAEDILRILREEWNLGNKQAVKVTYKPESDQVASGGASRKPDELIQAFRNAYDPRVAVTVDMIATGTDIKPLECLVFMRSVRSRALFEQMKGRGVRVIADADFQAVTPDAQTKTHFVIVDCVGVMEDEKVDPPLDREPTVAFRKLVDRVRWGDMEEATISTLAARLDRMDRRLTPDQKRHIEAASGGTSLRSIVSGLLNAIDPDKEVEAAREMFELPEDGEPAPEQLKAAQQSLRKAAVEPIKTSVSLCDAMEEVRKAQDIIIDDLSKDQITTSRPREDLSLDYDAEKELVSEFKKYCEEHRDEFDALRILYSKPYGERPTRDQLRELVDAIRLPPRAWTPEAIWKAFERVEASRVRGASGGRLLTDLISLVRHAMGVEEELVSYEDVARERFENWLAQQRNGGREFTDEQLEWLGLIKERIIVDAEMTTNDFEELPFTEKGGLWRAHALFGDELGPLVDELNRELVA